MGAFGDESSPSSSCPFCSYFSLSSTNSFFFEGLCSIVFLL